MSKRVRAVALAAAAMGAVGVVVPSAAHAATTPPSVTIPPLCLRLPVPNPVVPSAQIQIGYCPS